MTAMLRSALDRSSGLANDKLANAIEARLAILSEPAGNEPARGAEEVTTLQVPDGRSRRSTSRSSIRYLAVLAAGLVLGTSAFAAGYAVSPDFRKLLRSAFTARVSGVPRIAVRPFTARNGKEMESDLAGGVTIGVTYGLYAITARDLFVVTVPTETGGKTGIGELEYADDLGVRYLISGSVETEGTSVRVFVRCLDTQTGADVWQDRFTRPVTEAFELQDEITLRILTGLNIDLSSAERNRIQYLDDTDNLEAWLLAANGVRNLIKIDPQNLDEALASYQRALAIDPDYMSARRGLAWHALLQVRFGTSPDPSAAIAEARNHLNVILRRSANDGMGKALEGLLLLLENSWEKSIEAGIEGTQLLPGSADVWAVLAHSYTFVGKPELALEAIDKAMALSPGHPEFYNWIKGRALRLAGEPDAAIAMLNQSANPADETLVRLVELAAAYSAAGQIEQAQAVARRIKQTHSGFTASNWVLHPAMQDPVQQSLEFELLSKAGL
jgi:TolB-like protein